MFTPQAILNIIGVMLSLTPFIGVGYYFGRLEKRFSANEKKLKNVDDRVFVLEKNLGVIA